MWTSLETMWKETFRLAWASFCAGTVPVGCVICNEQGEIVARGQNAIADRFSSSPLAGTNLAHAEVIALSQLQKVDHPKIREYTLYTSLEPCPMCFGASVMMNIRRIHYAARDGVAGSLQLNTATPYLRRRKIKTELLEPSFEVFQIALVTAFELERDHPGQEERLGHLRADCPEGVAIGTLLFQEGYFAEAVREGYPVEEAFAQVISKGALTA